MKSRALHIFSTAFLIGSLLFAQVVVNFFHKNHDVHQVKSVSTPLKSGQAGIQKHGEHCKVCSIDVFNHAFDNAVVLQVQLPHTISHPALPVVCAEGLTVSYTKDRAPPFSLR